MNGPFVHVKVCGVTSVHDALFCIDAGASSIGLNFVDASSRKVTRERAKEIVRAVGSRGLVVAVVADCSIDAMMNLRDETGVGCLQLHGDEPASALAALLPHAYKAVRVRDAADIDAARAYPGEYILVDAKSDRGLGGTGESFDWNLAKDLARERKLTVAGGLRPDNVGAAIRVLRPYCVDVASGVESSAGVKDPKLVDAFIRAVREAALAT